MFPRAACLTTFICHLGLSALFAKPILVHWDNISLDTGKLASAELARLSQEGARGGRLAATAFRGARLEEPLYYYSCDSTLTAFDEDPANDLVPYMKWRSVVYPVSNGQTTIGIIRIKRLDTGQSLAFFGPVDPKLIDTRKGIVQKVIIQPGQRLSLLSTGLAGDFYIVEDGTRIYSMFPANGKTMRMLGFPDQQITAPPGLTVE